MHITLLCFSHRHIFPCTHNSSDHSFSYVLLNYDSYVILVFCQFHLICRQHLPRLTTWEISVTPLKARLFCPHKLSLSRQPRMLRLSTVMTINHPPMICHPILWVLPTMLWYFFIKIPQQILFLSSFWMVTQCLHSF